MCTRRVIVISSVKLWWRQSFVSLCWIIQKAYKKWQIKTSQHLEPLYGHFIHIFLSYSHRLFCWKDEVYKGIFVNELDRRRSRLALWRGLSDVIANGSQFGAQNCVWFNYRWAGTNMLSSIALYGGGSHWLKTHKNLRHASYCNILFQSL